MGHVEIVVFMMTSLVLIVTPGQDMILVMSRSIANGQRAGLATALGISAGLLVHTVLAAVGVGAILQGSQILFTIVKCVGAGYLLYLGFKTLRAPALLIEAKEEKKLSFRQLFLHGAISNMSNPKIAIFYFSFMPQFIPKQTMHPTMMLLFLGVTFSLLTVLVKGAVAFFAGHCSAWLRYRPSVQRWMHRASGAVLVGLGVRLACDTK